MRILDCIEEIMEEVARQCSEVASWADKIQLNLPASNKLSQREAFTPLMTRCFAIFPQQIKFLDELFAAAYSSRPSATDKR
jgi:hypothetical protein